MGPPTSLIGIVLGFFLSFSNFFIMLQCEFWGLCIVHLICTFKKFVAFKMHLQEYIDSDDHVLSSMAERMMEKYNKNWGDLDKNVRLT